ncbi:hypothetical protein [Candidatus Cyanaurora vandensis]|uniref:hypothetical protein n=1 Tax=Candidatus Cyanaurora vandensis TaxID=2714958 RepID=UPI00257F810C|nr:hypothetical protein [Candidatus Cyanaurora vandensis]
MATVPLSWFDEATGQVSLTQYFQQMESWQRAMTDGVISPEEIRTQGERVVSLLKEVEPLVTPEQHLQLSEIFAEMAVLQAMQGNALTTALQPKQGG